MPGDPKPLCVIPARGGSKRFPRKNVALFRGVPLVGLAIRTAFESRVYSRVVVSTDDEEIASVAREFGAVVHARPAPLATDFITLEPVLLDVLDTLESQGESFATGSVMLTTSPLRRPEDVRAAYDRFIGLGADFLMVVSRYVKSPLLALRPTPAGYELMFPELARQQPAPATVVDTGFAYFARTRALRQSGTFYGPGLAVHEVPADRAIDVDEPYHLRLAEALDTIVPGAAP